jgi:hypothetical protein
MSDDQIRPPAPVDAGDDGTQLVRRRRDRAPREAEPDDATRLTARTPDAAGEPDDATQLVRRPAPPLDDATRVVERPAAVEEPADDTVLRPRRVEEPADETLLRPRTVDEPADDTVLRPRTVEEPVDDTVLRPRTPEAPADETLLRRRPPTDVEAPADDTVLRPRGDAPADATRLARREADVPADGTRRTPRSRRAAARETASFAPDATTDRTPATERYAIRTPTVVAVPTAAPTASPAVDAGDGGLAARIVRRRAVRTRLTVLIAVSGAVFVAAVAGLVTLLSL